MASDFCKYFLQVIFASSYCKQFLQVIFARNCLETKNGSRDIYLKICHSGQNSRREIYRWKIFSFNEEDIPQVPVSDIFILLLLLIRPRTFQKNSTFFQIKFFYSPFPPHKTKTFSEKQHLYFGPSSLFCFIFMRNWEKQQFFSDQVLPQPLFLAASTSSLLASTSLALDKVTAVML